MPWRPSLAEEYRLTVRNRSHLQNCGLRWMLRKDGRKLRLRYRFRSRCSARFGLNLRPRTGFAGFTCWWSRGPVAGVRAARQNRDASTRPRLRAPPRRRGRDEVVPQVWGSYRTQGPELLPAPRRHGAVACLRRCSTRPRRRSARRRTRRPAVPMAPPYFHGPLPTLIEHGFVVLVHGSRDDAENVRHEIAEVLDPPGLRLSRARTRIAPMREQFAVATDEVTAPKAQRTRRPCVEETFEVSTRQHGRPIGTPSCSSPSTRATTAGARVPEARTRLAGAHPHRGARLPGPGRSAPRRARH